MIFVNMRFTVNKCTYIDNWSRFGIGLTEKSDRK